MWEEVRHVLGRVFARAAVRELPAARVTVGVGVRVSDVTEGPPPGAGAREGEWRPRTRAVLLPPPQAQEGGGGVDLAAVATVVGGNAALRPAACPVHAVSVSFGGGAVRAWGGPMVTGGASHAVPTALSLPGPPSVALLTSRVETRRDRGLLTLRGGRAVPALARLADVPMTRLRRVSPEGFVAERAHLAAASGVPVADVALVGVFSSVPVAAVGHLAVAEGGERLRIWLKGDALGPKRTPGPKLVTVVLGRQRSTGRTLQAVMADKRPPGPEAP